jgi:TatD DNase family protein
VIGDNRSMFIDSHCHLDLPELQADAKNILGLTRDNAVTHALTISATLMTFPAVRGTPHSST